MKNQHPTFRIRIYSFLFVMLAITLINGSLRAQNLDFGAIPNPPFTLPNQVAGTPVSIPDIIAVNPPGGAAITMSILDISIDGIGSFCAPCASPLLLNGGPYTSDITFTVNASPAKVSISGLINMAAAGSTVRFVLRASAGGTECDRIYSFKIIAPVDLMLVLDGSGSMGWGYDGNYSPPAGQRRWDGLKTGVGIMAAQLGALNLLPADLLGLRLFSTAVITPAAPFNGPNLVSMQTNVAQLTAPAVLTTNPPDGWTALGDGILAGRDMLHNGPATHKKAMIVFSDGIQNRGDLVKETGVDAYKVTNLNQNISDGGKIQIYTIGLGTTGSLPPTMEQIALKNGGVYLNSQAGAGPEFTTFFTTQLANIFSGRSPQIVDIRKSAFPVATGDQPSKTEQSFSINKGSSSVIVTLIAPRRNEPHFTSVVKDGVELIQYVQQTYGPEFTTISIRLPMTSLPVTSLNGEWKVKAQLGTRPKNEIPYTLMIVTDDHLVHSVYALGSGTHKVGDILSPKTKLFQGGKPVTNATVKGIVLKPGEDINDLLARTKADYKVSSVDSASPDVAKLAILMNDSSFVNKIKVQNQLVNLVYNAADSSYKGTFNGLDVSGVYQIIYITTATDPEAGKIQRYHQKSFYVRFPDIDLSKSNLLVSLDPKTGNSIITARFISKNGKYIGPGWGSVISIDAPGLKIENVEDMGDGTYKIHFNGKLAGNGQLSLFNETIYNGNLENIDKTGNPIIDLLKKWWYLLLLLIAAIVYLIRKKKNNP